jgi:mRNA interferase MazF
MPKRYEIYLVRLDPVEGSEIGKTRPCVVLSDDTRNQFLKTVVVCPLTSQLREDWRCRLRIRCAGREADVAVDQIRTVNKSRLVKRIDRLKPNGAQLLRELVVEMYGSA